MSADNGIYILKTPNQDGFEYRVVHAQAIDNIYWNEGGKYDSDGDPKAVVEYFGDSKAFLDEKEATQEAFNILDKMEEEGDFVEYGVSRIDLPYSFDYYIKNSK